MYSCTRIIQPSPGGPLGGRRNNDQRRRQEQFKVGAAPRAFWAPRCGRRRGPGRSRTGRTARVGAVGGDEGRDDLVEEEVGLVGPARAVVRSKLWACWAAPAASRSAIQAATLSALMSARPGRPVGRVEGVEEGLARPEARKVKPWRVVAWSAVRAAAAA